jgi:hypothetical protein
MNGPADLPPCRPLRETFRLALKAFGWILLYGGTRGSASDGPHFSTRAQYFLVAAGTFVLVAEHDKAVSPRRRLISNLAPSYLFCLFRLAG